MDPGERRGSGLTSYGDSLRHRQIGALQLGWLFRLYLAGTGLSQTVLLWVFVVLAVLELSVPRWAERAQATTWHPHHIAERYGLFTIILLGETVLAASNAVRRAVETTHITGELVTVAASGLVMVFALWWLYFLQPAGPRLEARRDRSYWWGYGHYGIFVALAALGAGLEVAVEQTSHDVHLSPTAAGYAVAIPVAVFVSVLWAVHRTISEPSRVHLSIAGSGTAIVLLLPLATPWIGSAATLALLTATCVALVVGASWHENLKQ